MQGLTEVCARRLPSALALDFQQEKVRTLLHSFLYLQRQILIERNPEPNHKAPARRQIQVFKAIYILYVLVAA